MARTHTHIDCFAGPGGFCTGMKMAGFRTLMAFEKVGTVCETYAANHPEVDLVQGDIRDVPDDQFDSCEVDLVTAGFPCETFSTAGKNSRHSYDHRQTLFLEAVRVAVATKAKFLLCENVPAILTKPLDKGGTRLVIDEIREQLVDAGYLNQFEAVLNAADYGVPQTRRRFFLLACRDTRVDIQRPAPLAARQVTVQDAFHGLPTVPSEDATAVYSSDAYYSWLLGTKPVWNATAWAEGLTQHICPGHRDSTVERFKLIPQGGKLSDLFKTLPEEEIAELQRRRVLPKVPYHQRGQRLHPGRPSPTVTSHCLDELVHPTEPRCLTVREAARLQSFPDGYEFKGPLSCPHRAEKQDRYEQIGDAVPPLLAAVWGRAVAALLDK